MRVLAILVSTLAVAISRPRNVPTNSYLPADVDAQHEEEKHFYFYASPNDASYTTFHINVVPKIKKNTKVLFVKAPHHAGVIPNVVAPPSLAEDKTLVYVLLKKPITGQSISIPANLGVKSLKPEVYFLKYGKKHDAEAQVQAGISGQRVGLNVAELGGEKEFVAVLGNGNKNGYHYEPAPDTFDAAPHVEEDRFTHVDVSATGDAGASNDQDGLEPPSRSDSGDDVTVTDSDNDDNTSDNDHSSENAQADDDSHSDTNGNGDDNTHGNGDDNTHGNGDDNTNGNGDDNTDDSDANSHTDTTSDDDNTQVDDNVVIEDHAQSNDASADENNDEDDDGDDGVSTKVEINDSA